MSVLDFSSAKVIYIPLKLVVIYRPLDHQNKRNDWWSQKKTDLIFGNFWDWVFLSKFLDLCECVMMWMFVKCLSFFSSEKPGVSLGANWFGARDDDARCKYWWFRNPKANHLRCIKPVVNNGIFTISAGAGFLNHQQYHKVPKNPSPFIFGTRNWGCLTEQLSKGPYPKMALCPMFAGPRCWCHILLVNKPFPIL